MTLSKRTKALALSFVYGVHLLLALLLWLCGIDGNIMLGILLIVLYRPSLWLTPLWVTLICWWPPRSKTSLRARVLFYFVQLLLCTALFVLCYLLFGNWY